MASCPSPKNGETETEGMEMEMGTDMDKERVMEWTLPTNLDLTARSSLIEPLVKTCVSKLWNAVLHNWRCRTHRPLAVVVILHVRPSSKLLHLASHLPRVSTSVETTRECGGYAATPPHPRAMVCVL